MDQNPHIIVTAPSGNPFIGAIQFGPEDAPSSHRYRREREKKPAHDLRLQARPTGRRFRNGVWWARKVKTPDSHIDIVT